MFGRDEKVSGSRLTAVQYVILGVFLILAYGLWRLQVVQSDLLCDAGGKEQDSQCSDSGAPRARS